MESENMAEVESTGTSSRINEQNEKHEKYVVRDFFYFLPLHLQKQKGGSAER